MMDSQSDEFYSLISDYSWSFIQKIKCIKYIFKLYTVLISDDNVVLKKFFQWNVKCKADHKQPNEELMPDLSYNIGTVAKKKSVIIEIIFITRISNNTQRIHIYLLHVFLFYLQLLYNIFVIICTKIIYIFLSDDI